MTKDRARVRFLFLAGRGRADRPGPPTIRRSPGWVGRALGVTSRSGRRWTQPGHVVSATIPVTRPGALVRGRIGGFSASGAENAPIEVLTPLRQRDDGPAARA